MNAAHAHYQHGNLNAAIESMAAELRQEPGNTGKRAFYAELLCLRGDLVKADQQLETLVSLEPDAALTINTWRNLLHAAQARRDVFSSGRTPDLVAPLTERMEKRLTLLLLLREGRNDEAAALALALEAARAPAAAVINGLEVDDIRDLDDCSGGILEVLASNGKYFWVEQAMIVSLVLHPPERPLDLLWRRGELVLNTGTEGEIFIPSIYASPTSEASALLGRSTDWDDSTGLVRGIGHCTWLVGDQAMALGDINTLAIKPLISQSA